MCYVLHEELVLVLSVFAFVVGLSVDEIALLLTLETIVLEVNSQMNNKCLSVGSGIFGVTRMNMINRCECTKIRRK